MDCPHPSSEHVSDPESNIIEDHLSNLLEDLSVYLLDDIVDDPIFHPDSLPSSMPIPSSVPSLRRSTRVSKPPPYLQPYKCNTLSTRYPIAKYVSHQKLSLVILISAIVFLLLGNLSFSIKLLVILIGKLL